MYHAVVDTGLALTIHAVTPDVAKECFPLWATNRTSALTDLEVTHDIDEFCAPGPCCFGCGGLVKKVPEDLVLAKIVGAPIAAASDLLNVTNPIFAELAGFSDFKPPAARTLQAIVL
jgi:hypothetical protein